MSTCFVVQGYGRKTDPATGRVLDLDASYAVIKSVVQAAGLSCVRADEINHAGTIDIPMYEQLLQADLVIADLSTGNLNAAFELGVRYALRPRTTLVIAEEDFRSPFNLSHIHIERYKHLGEDIGTKEAARLQTDLAAKIRAILKSDRPDSPVYTLLKLDPPGAPAPAPAIRTGPPAGSRGIAAPPELEVPASGVGGEFQASASGGAKAGLNMAELRQKAETAFRAGRFLEAADLWATLHQMNPQKDFFLQQQVLATYKSGQPDEVTALRKAQTLIQPLRPESTNDPETLGLWGSIHKRLWEKERKPEHLDEAIASYERGFRLKQDYYNGINFAFLLNLRAHVAADEGRMDEAVTDTVLANRVRKEVLRYAEDHLGKELKPAEQFWALASQAEAKLGLGDEAGRVALEARMIQLNQPAWMMDTYARQTGKLRTVMAESRQRMSPPSGATASAPNPLP